MQVNSNYKLSICIPTYNRSDTLKYLLNNIIVQLNSANLWDKVQICISDNGSNDNTDEMVEQFKQKYPIIYHKNPENLGADRNFLQAVALASGEYCWLFGSDDRFEDGAIIEILHYLNKFSNLAGMSVYHRGYRGNFESVIFGAGYKLFDDVLFYDSVTIHKKIAPYFGYLSGCIIKKIYWDEVIKSFPVGNYHRSYVHVYIISQMIKAHPNWLYIGKPLVGWRAGNDSFLAKGKDGLVARMRIDYEYFMIAADVFGKESQVYKHHLNAICGDHVYAHLLGMKVAGNVNIWPLFPEISKMFWRCPSFYFRVMPVFLVPRFVLIGIRSIIRFARKHGMKV